MPRLRSVAVVALLWVAALAGSSAPAPEGFGGARGAESPASTGMLVRPAHAAAVAEPPAKGKRWALVGDPDGKRWAVSDGVSG